MVESQGPLQVGVVGLGPQWRRWLAPAVAAAPQLGRVVLVADAHRRRADDVAAELRCPSSPAAGRLIRHPEVDVLLLADPQWHGLWALEQAISLGKPTLCAVPLGAEPTAFAWLEPALRAAERTVHFFEPWQAPALAARVREIQADAVGPLLRLQARLTTPEPEPGWASLARVAALAGPFGDGAVQSVQAIGADAIPQAIHLHGQAGWRMLLQAETGPRLKLRMELTCARGTIWLRWPDRLRWRLGNTLHVEKLRWRSPMGEVFALFHELVWNGQFDEANQAAAIENGRLLAAALRSAAAGGAIENA